MRENDALRKSCHIRGRQASRFFKAAKHSRETRPLNLFVTISLTHTACPARLASTVTAEICAKFGRWLRHQSRKALSAGRRGYGPPTYETVIEAPDGRHHLHWLVYVPHELRPLFEATLPKWLSKTAGTIHAPAGAIYVEPIDTIMALSRYCMKGVDPHHARRCFVRPQDQGIVWGRRVSISRSLGPSARKKAGVVAELPSGASGDAPISKLAA